jgi:hypothetical protein
MLSIGEGNAMKRMIMIVALLAGLSGCAEAQKGLDFDAFFIDKTMRVDYFHIGNAEVEEVTVDQIYQQGIWAGSRVHLIDPFGLGRYRVKVFDAASGRLIFSKGFDSYFGEYKTSGPALAGKKRTYHESALIPYPKKKILFTVEVRKRDNSYGPLFSREIDPAGITVIRENPIPGVKVFDLLRSGDPHRKVDIAFVAEGYTSGEEAKLEKDLKRFAEVLFTLEPYKSNRDKFNLYGVFKPSPESGCDEPSHGTFKTTSLNATFDSLGSERYLLTEDNKSLRDIAAHVPYDALFIMINHKRYGGGGIYNFFCTFTTDSQWYEYLFLHEFGHSFAGLADEYYTSQVAYNDFYPRGIEPAEPNITALLDPGRLKWSPLVTPGTEIPTPWEKGEFDEMDNAYQKKRTEINEKIARMKREGSPAVEVAEVEVESARLSKENADRVDAFLRGSRFWGKVGVFEGAGYSAEGLYRPEIDCLMFTKGAKPFCRVCEAAVLRMILHYAE